MGRRGGLKFYLPSVGVVDSLGCIYSRNLVYLLKAKYECIYPSFVVW